MRNSAKIIPILFCLLFSGNSFAWDPTIGPEMAYENDETKAAFQSRHKPGEKSTDEMQKPTATGELVQSQRFRDAILKQCLKCVVTVIPGKFGLDTYHILFPNKYWIVISVDPGVSELQTPELTYEEYDRLEPFIEAQINAPGKSVGLKLKTNGDGHLNFGANATFGTAENLAEFLLDQFNHPELALGVLGKDLANGPHLTSQEPAQVEEFLRVMDDVKAGKIKSIRDLANEVNEKVYFRSTNDQTVSGGRHYQAVSMKRLSWIEFLTKDQPVEIRYTAGQSTFRGTLNMYKLFIKRIEFLRRKPSFSNVQRKFTTPPGEMNAQEKLSRFYIFVTEMGESFEEYRSLIFDEKMTRSELDNFVQEKTPWKNTKKSFETISRYIPDIETSEWVQKRFREIIHDKNIPQELRSDIVSAIKTSIHRPDIPMANRRAVYEFQKEILVQEDWIEEPPKPAELAGRGGGCEAVKTGFFRQLLSFFKR